MSRRLSPEDQRLVDRFNKLEAAYNLTHGKKTKAEVLAKLPDPPSPESLKLKRTFRSYIPGVFEFFTDQPDFIFVVPKFYKTFVNVIMMIIMFSSVSVISKPLPIFCAALAVILTVGMIIQQVMIGYLLKTHKFEVFRFGETPYTHYLKYKQKPKSSNKV